MEIRYHEYERASKVYERLVACHPEPKIWIKWAKYEEDVRNNAARAREVYQMSLEYFGAGEGGVEEEEQLEKAQSLYNAFAKLEIRQKEYERARVIYKYALDRLPRSKSAGLYSAYTLFEKQFGDRSGIESTVLGKRRIEYEEELKHTPFNYDIWIDYCRLEEDAFRTENVSPAEGGADRVRDIYERAIAQRPPSNEKRHWRRYIFLWLNVSCALCSRLPRASMLTVYSQYALFEETDTKDIERSRQIYEACIKLIPHHEFTFAKVWTLYAEFEVRQLNLDKARKLLGRAIGMCPKEKLFKDYITLELQLREFDRCRQIYQKYIAVGE
jgi:crooked neck